MIRFGSWLQRHSYLLRLFISIFALLCIPVAALGFFLTRRSYDRLYEERISDLTAAAGHVESRWKDLEEDLIAMSYRLRMDLWKSSTLSRDYIESHPYHRYEAKEMLEGYLARTTAVRLGLHYIGSDYVITSGSCYTMQQFVDIGGSETLLTAGGSRSTFSAAGADRGVWTVARTVGIGTVTGNEKNAVLFWDFDTTSLTRGLGITDAAYEAAILSPSGELLWTTADFPVRLLAEADVAAFLEGDGNAELIEAGGSRTVWARARNEDCLFLLEMPEDGLMAGFSRLYTALNRTLLMFALGIALLASATVLVNYHPVHTLVSSLPQDIQNESSASGEMEQIRVTFEQLRENNARVQEENAERQHLFEEQIARTLLQGADIEPKLLERLGVRASHWQTAIWPLPENFTPAEDDLLRLQLRRQLEPLSGVILLQMPGERVLSCVLYSDSPLPEEAFLQKQLSDAIQTLLHRSLPLVLGKATDDISQLGAEFQDACSLLNRTRAEEEKPQEESLERDILRAQLIAYTDEHFSEVSLTLTELAMAFQMPAYKASRTFKELIGIGFKEYVAAKKLEYARDLLLSTDLSVGEIAETCGYASASYFISRFKLAYGTSPASIRTKTAEHE